MILTITRGGPFEVDIELPNPGAGTEINFDHYLTVTSAEKTYQFSNYENGISGYRDWNGVPHIILSIYDTNQLDVGRYTWSYKIEDLEGNILSEISGEINIVDDESYVHSDRPLRNWDAYKPQDLVLEEERVLFRLSICNSCPAYDQGVCKQCNCNILDMVKNPTSRCPVHKW